MQTWMAYLRYQQYDSGAKLLLAMLRDYPAKHSKAGPSRTLKVAKLKLKHGDYTQEQYDEIAEIITRLWKIYKTPDRELHDPDPADWHEYKPGCYKRINHIGEYNYETY